MVGILPRRVSGVKCEGIWGSDGISGGVVRNGTVRACSSGLVRAVCCNNISSLARDSVPSVDAVLVLRIPYFALVSPRNVIRSIRRSRAQRLISAIMKVLRSLG